MKKKIVSSMMTLLLVLSLSLSAFATGNLDLKVFHGEDDITVFPESHGNIAISVNSMGKDTKGTTVVDGSIVHFLPMVIASQKYDLFCITVDYFSRDKANIDEIDFQIDKTLYKFGKVQKHNKWDNELNCYNETMMFPIDRNSINFMEDFEAHKNDSIKVTLVDRNHSTTFELTDDIKNGWLHLYNLYEKAGGTNRDNLDMVWLYSNSNTYSMQTIS